jgi:NADPH:quinone reductase-like Zn-dependent oxidoreductase
LGAERCAVVKDASELASAFAATGAAPVANESQKGENDLKFDVVLELAGGAYVAADLMMMASRGRLMLVGTMAGAKAELPLGTILSQRLEIVGTVMRARSLDEKIAVTDAFTRDVVPLLERGAVVPVVDRVFPMCEISDANIYMEQNRNAGKIVITVP